MTAGVIVPQPTYQKYLYSITTTQHKYVTQNSKVVRETIGSGSTAKVLDFIYDESGRPFALKYSTNGGSSSFTTYYYVLNLQGDVVKLVEILADDTGIWSYGEIANYEYDAWGSILSVTDERGNAITDFTHLAHLNPLRYRGYYYDVETQFYYLQSRYYDPITRRFINADSIASTGQGFTGTNMFAYCGNNPVRRTNSIGTWWIADAWDAVCDWFSDTFDFAVYVADDVPTGGLDMGVVGLENGNSTSARVAGDDSKPVTFYLSKPATGWHIWDYKVGVNLDVGDGGVDVGFSPGTADVSPFFHDTSVTFTNGIIEAGITVTNSAAADQVTTGPYTKVFSRPWIPALAIAAPGILLPVTMPMIDQIA